MVKSLAEKTVVKKALIARNPGRRKEDAYEEVIRNTMSIKGLPLDDPRRDKLKLRNIYLIAKL